MDSNTAVALRADVFTGSLRNSGEVRWTVLSRIYIISPKIINTKAWLPSLRKIAQAAAASQSVDETKEKSEVVLSQREHVTARTANALLEWQGLIDDYGPFKTFHTTKRINFAKVLPSDWILK